MAVFAKTASIRRCLRELLASDGCCFSPSVEAPRRSLSSFLRINQSAPLHRLCALQVFFEISFPRYDVMRTIIRQGISLL